RRHTRFSRDWSSDVCSSDLWLDNNLHPHKQPGYASVTVSLKPVGGAPGDATDAQIDVVADLAEQYSYDELRVTHEQNLVLPHVRSEERRLGTCCRRTSVW